MPLLFTHPAGFWALLGIPVVILIHFLQRQSRVLPSTTLFLLDAIDRQSVQGRKLDRLRNSLPLWLQLLGVLILTWLLVEPRWNRDASTRRIVTVIDSSASMSAFKSETIAALQEELPPLFASRERLSLTLIESHRRGGTLYRGDSLNELLAAIEAWKPSDSAHSPETALQIGRSLAGADGTLIFVSDHGIDPPYGAALLSVGAPIENVGFAGHRTERREDETVWEVTVINHGRESQTREWRLIAGDQATAPRSLTLAAGEVRTLAGRFPESGEKIQLQLSPDRFQDDDKRYLQAPSPKPISTAHDVEAGVEPLVRDLINSLENAPLFTQDPSAGTAPDLVFSTYNPLQPQPFPPQSIVFLHQSAVPRDFFSGFIAAENHPLIEGLNWQGLIARKTPSIPARRGDRVLLWQGDRPLIILHAQPGQQQLLFNFDVARSNAPRLPAFIILIHRFVDELRAEKVAPSAVNLDLGQQISLSTDRSSDAAEVTLRAGGTVTRLSPADLSLLRAPRVPGFFSLAQGETVLLHGAANFADSREADFSAAMTRSDLGALVREVVENETVTDPWWPLWMIGFLLLVIAIWTILSRPVAGAGDFSTPAS